MKLLITGARGMLAHDVINSLRAEHELHVFDEFSLDICDKSIVLSTLAALHPHAVINCAAYTNVDDCETKREIAYAVNATGVGNLASACRNTGAMLYHVSTDFVFNGSKQFPYNENDEPHPLSVYGASKLDGERLIQNILTDYVIVRTSWLFGKHGKNFVETILQRAREQHELRVVNDQTGCPTYTVDLAEALKKLIALQVRGIYHVTNTGACTWHAFAEYIVELSGLSTRVIPITSRELKRPAQRPVYSVLDNNKFNAETGMQLRSWENALKSYLFVVDKERTVE